MNLQDVEDDLPILLFFYEDVLTILEDQKTAAPRKVSRTAVVESFLMTKNFKTTANQFGVSRATINGIIYTAFRTARRLAGLSAPSIDD
jgi:hypothetical protein